MTTIMLVYHALIIAVCCMGVAMPAPAVYDQRQNGTDWNVQIELKNVRVVALLDSELLEDYTDYDYFYDYADFTIKPSKPFVSSSTEGIIEKNDVTDVTELSSPSRDSTSLHSSISASLANTTSATTGEEMLNTNLKDDSASSTPSSDGNNSASADVESATTGVSSTTMVGLARKRCRSGYAPGGNGRCRRVNKRWLSLP